MTAPPGRVASDFLLAVHEAGHTTMAHALGLPLGPLEIEPGRGGMAWTGSVGERLSIADEIAVLRTLESGERSMRERLWVSLAGPAADHIVRGLPHWDREQDAEAIHRFCIELQTPPWRHWPCVTDRLRASWPAVEALATELCWLQRVEGPHAAELLTPHLTAGAWTEDCHRC